MTKFAVKSDAIHCLFIVPRSRMQHANTNTTVQMNTSKKKNRFPRTQRLYKSTLKNLLYTHIFFIINQYQSIYLGLLVNMLTPLNKVKIYLQPKSPQPGMIYFSSLRQASSSPITILT